MTILSMHLADVTVSTLARVLRRDPTPREVPGLHWGSGMVGLDFHPGRRPSNPIRAVGMLAVWEDDEALDSYLTTDHPLAAAVRGGWSVRADRFQTRGSWHEIAQLQPERAALPDDTTIISMTYGQVAWRQLARLSWHSSPAEATAVDADRGAVFAVGGMRLRPLVAATMTVWSSLAQLTAYAYGRRPGDHAVALRQQSRSPMFLRNSFARGVPRDERGSWRGRQPVAEAAAATG